MPEQVPPGRAGRLWLAGRLASARRSQELLDRKRSLLRREVDRREHLRHEARQRWVDSCVEAERWGLRATVVEGATAVALSASSVADRAEVDVTWRNTMGVHHPDDAVCTLAPLSSSEAAAAGAAIAPAAAAYRSALGAAVACAVADASWRLLSDELHAIDRRHRAIERRRIPDLERSLHQLVLRLDEFEREDRVVTRWAQRHQGDRSDRTSSS